MCMCRCTRILYCLGNISYIFEKLATCCAMTAVVSCIVITLLVMLGVGVGLGYNYCYVDFTSGRGSSDAFDESEELMKMPTNDTESNNSTSSRPDSNKSAGSGNSDSIRNLADLRKGFGSYNLQPIHKNLKIYVPLNDGFDFSKLLNKIRTANQNVTLHLVV